MKGCCKEADSEPLLQVEALQERERDMQMESTGAKEELKRARKVSGFLPLSAPLPPLSASPPFPGAPTPSAHA